MMRPNKAAAGRPGGGLGGGGGGVAADVATVEVVFSSSPHIWLSYSDVSLYSILFALHNS